MGRLLVSLVEGEREDGSCKEPSAGDRVEPSRRDASLVGVDVWMETRSLCSEVVIGVVSSDGEREWRGRTMSLVDESAVDRRRRW